MKLNETIQTSCLARLLSTKQQLACMLVNHFPWRVARWLGKVGPPLKNANKSQETVQDISVSHDFMNGTYGTMLFFPTASLAQAFSELENHTMCKLVGEFVAGRRRPFINAAGRTARTSDFSWGTSEPNLKSKKICISQCPWMHRSCWRQPSIK